VFPLKTGRQKLPAKWPVPDKVSREYGEEDFLEKSIKKWRNDYGKE
jgi:hypothetical protein